MSTQNAETVLPTVTLDPNAPPTQTMQAAIAIASLTNRCVRSNYVEQYSGDFAYCVYKLMLAPTLVPHLIMVRQYGVEFIDSEAEYHYHKSIFGSPSSEGFPVSLWRLYMDTPNFMTEYQPVTEASALAHLRGEQGHGFADKLIEWDACDVKRTRETYEVARAARDKGREVRRNG